MFHVRTFMLEQNKASRSAAFPYPVDPNDIAHRVGAIAAHDGWCADYAQELYRRWFLQHQAPGDAAATRDLLLSLGRDAHEVMRRAALSAPAPSRA